MTFTIKRSIITNMGAEINHRALIVVLRQGGPKGFLISIRAATGWLDEAMANQAASTLIAQIENVDELSEWGWQEEYVPPPQAHRIWIPDVTARDD